MSGSEPLKITLLKITRLIPLLIIMVAFLSFFLFGWHQYFSFSVLNESHHVMIQWSQDHFFIAMLGYCVLYTLMVTASLPTTILLTLIGGYLFGMTLGTILTVFSSTLGSVLFVLAIKMGMEDGKVQQRNKIIQATAVEIQKNPFSYLLFLRLMPIFPFWMINVTCGILNMPISTFAIGTFIGIIPGSFLYISLGSGLEHIFDQGETLNFGIIFEPRILLSLFGLGLLSLIPVVNRKIKATTTL